MNRIKFTFSLVEIDTGTTLLLDATWGDKDVPMALSSLSMFLFNNEKELHPDDTEFAYILGKYVRKLSIKGEFKLGIPSAGDCLSFFQKAKQLKIPLQYDKDGEISQLSFVTSLPVFIAVTGSNKSLTCELKTHYDLTFFESKDKTFILCNYLLCQVNPDLYYLLETLSKKQTLTVHGEEAVSLFQEVIDPNTDVLDWDVANSVKKLVPQSQKPNPIMKLSYHEPMLTPELLFKYGSQLIAPSDTDKVIEDYKTGIKYQRQTEYEIRCQDIVMQLFHHHDLPFMLSSPGDIARFMDKIIPQLFKKKWIIDSNVPEFKIIEDPISIDISIRSGGEGNWFDFEPSCDIMGQKHSLQELARLMVDTQGYIKTKKGFVKLDQSSAESLSLLAKNKAFTVGKKFSKRDLLPLIHATNISSKDDDVKTYIEQTRSFHKVCHVAPHTKFKATLRDYQQFGMNWMHFLSQNKFGGILADDMGLGKTIQALAFSSVLPRKSPVLIVGPSNVIYNWEDEIKKFFPPAKTVVYTGATRHTKTDKALEADFVITSFGVIKKDVELFSAIPFEAMFIDEAQYVKNPKTQISEAIKQIKADFIIALTGTPIENYLTDLWNLFDVVMPGYLGSFSAFQTAVDGDNLSHLKMQVKPFILRREKQEVLDELPEKTEVVLKSPLSEQQALLYRTVLEAAKKGVKSLGGKQERLHILTALLKLRQICLHPGLLPELEGQHYPSAKFDIFKNKISEIVSEGHKVVCFSQFNKMLDIAQTWLTNENIYYERIDGSASPRARQDSVKRFQSEEKPGVFIISLKAGGVGINLTAADYVIHLDPWWNPAVESQATDRVHRMGQTNKVVVYKLIAEDTIEEKIQELQESKKALLGEIIDIDTVADKKIDFSELKSLLFS